MNVKQTVPALTAEPAAASDGERNRELPGRPTVLVVDDEERNRLFLRPVLHKHYRIVEAGCGPKALGVLQTQVIDLVLLDVMMPEMTGFEARKAIKDRYGDPYLPVRHVTGLAYRERGERGLQSGADNV